MGKMKIRGIISANLGILVVILLFFLIFSMKWYHYEGSERGRFVERDMGLYRERTTVENATKTMEYEEDATMIGGRVKGVLDLAGTILIIGLLLAIVFSVLAFLAGGARIIPGWVPLSVGIIAGIVIMTSPIYMMAAFPDAWESDRDDSGDDTVQPGPWRDFQGSGVDTTGGVLTETEFGPGWAFYVSIGAGVVLIVLGGLCKGISRKRVSRDLEGSHSIFDY